MYMLIATIYVILNGAPLPPDKTPHNFQFASLEKCIAFKDSEPAAEALARLNAFIAAKLQNGATYTVTLSCEKVEHKDDGSI